VSEFEKTMVAFKLKGASDRKRTLREIAAELAEAGFATGTGKP